MATYRILFIGTHQDLQNIFDDCSDSSSESQAEVAFGYDYLSWYKNEEGEEVSTKSIREPIQDTYCDCLDVRDRKTYRCIDSIDWEKRPTKDEMQSYFDSLPDGTTVFYGYGHL